MTTTIDPDVTTRSRTLQVAGVHATGWQVALVWPAAILAAIFAVSLVFFSLLPEDGVEINTGGATFVFVFGMVLFVQAMTQTFPFTLGLSVTRGDFFRATSLVAVAHAILFGVVLFALSTVEQATDGFGVRMRMFSVVAPLTDGRVTELALYVALFALCNFLGMLFGVLYLRWRVVGLWTVALGSILVLGAAALYLTWSESWMALGSAIADAPRALTMVVLPVALTAASAAAGWTVLRRTTV